MNFGSNTGSMNSYGGDRGDRGDRGGMGGMGGMDDKRGEMNPNIQVDYKDVKTLKRFLSEDGKVLPRRRTGLSALNQRSVTTAIKRARHLGLLPYTSRD